MIPAFELKNVTLKYREQAIVQNACMTFPCHQITCLVGPSGVGKSTLLRTLNRLNDFTPTFHCSGSILYMGQDIYHDYSDATRLRQEVGMVFQKPCVYPKSIFDNVIFGVKHLKLNSKKEFPAIVERSLNQACLWNEVKDRLHHPATELSLGQQQRLSFARALAVQPNALLLDEPTSSLDAQAKASIEELILRLKENLSIILVSHHYDQVERLAGQVYDMKSYASHLQRPGSGKKLPGLQPNRQMAG